MEKNNDYFWDSYSDNRMVYGFNLFDNTGINRINLRNIIHVDNKIKWKY